MAFEITDPIIKWNVGTNVQPKFQIFDLHGLAIVISTALFRLHKRKGRDLIDSGSATVNNLDTSPKGETINTVQAVIDLGATDVDVGEYWLSFFVTLDSGESHVLRQLVEVEDIWN